MSPVLTAGARDVLFLLIHNKLPVKERLFRIGLALDPYCELCPGGIVADVEHFFCSCVRVAPVWSWIRGKIVGLMGASGATVSDWELVNLFLPDSFRTKDMVWLLGTYVAKVWEEVQVRGKLRLRFETFFGFLSFKYREANLGSRLFLGVIPGVLS